MMDFTYKVRILLIRIGKVLPFVICFFIFISYIECIYSLYANNYVLYDGFVILDKPISNFIGSYMEYNIQTVAVLTIISIAIHTCYWNKLACVYLFVNLMEKYIYNYELYETTIYSICVINILVSGFLTLKGIKNLIK